MSEEGKPTHLDLFSGIGGFALAAQCAGFRTIAFCEIDKYCQKVLAKNFGAVPDAARQQAHVELQRSSEPRGQSWQPMEAGSQTVRQENGQTSHDNASRFCPIFGDIFKLDGKQFRGISLVTGGFPCQPFSVAGKRRGKADDRHLWPEMLRVIKEARPAWVLGENVTGIIGMELDSVLSDLEAIGYATRSFIIPACGVDARHRRNRIWIIANSTSNGLYGRDNLGVGSIPLDKEQSTKTDESERGRRIGRVGEASKTDVVDATSGRCEQCESERESSRDACIGSQQIANTNSRGNPTARQRPSEWKAGESCVWFSEPDVCRVAHGIPSRVDRLRGLGNAIVPQVAFQILKAIRSLI